METNVVKRCALFFVWIISQFSHFFLHFFYRFSFLFFFFCRRTYLGSIARQTHFWRWHRRRILATLTARPIGQEIRILVATETTTQQCFIGQWEAQAGSSTSHNCPDPSRPLKNHVMDNLAASHCRLGSFFFTLDPFFSPYPCGLWVHMGTRLQRPAGLRWAKPNLRGGGERGAKLKNLPLNHPSKIR